MKKTVTTFLSAAIALTSLASCDKDDENATAKSQTYVLVHGAWQAPYVWDAVKADLQKAGNRVIVVELPGHGTDKTPTHTLRLDMYRDKVIEAISSVSENIILVGHSMGGMVITAVAEKIPDRISKLVYIGAFLPENGQSLTTIAFSDPGSQLGPLLIEAPDKLTLDVKADSLTYLFINDGSASAKQQVVTNYRAEPSIPLTNPVAITKENYGRVPKVYIKTLQDIVISPRKQDQMIAAAGITETYFVNTSHSPFLSQPQTVADLLLKIGNR